MENLPQSGRITISLPEEFLRLLEEMRRKTRESRSAFILRALRRAIGEARKEKTIAQYVGGYIDNPETPDEIAAAEASAAMLLAGDPWS